ncbi:LysR family transcriptional regulator [Mycolicibacter heraklionensis]|uniref:Probable hydrogen peroxide-inducible genes activator n=1 Tax=Mycolicibacter heraklionensis TaxID=512402 RepID=A0AA91IW53_9MYCO|nr:LysR family transcriptional regulator [Mycolicibacter heraklionensis]OBK80934.1 LysR family transcriptional regulator [Mycolicibacter heraklionensis]
MELRQLEYFVAVVEEANFTRAAQRVHVAQPAVSAQIGRLERELGQRLLDRSRREVRPTAAGAAVLPYAKAALAAVEDVRLAVDELSQLVRGTVTIGTVTAHPVDVPGLLAEFHAQYPNVEITLSTANSDELIEAVRGGDLDLAIVSVGPGEQPAGLDIEVVTDEPVDAAVSPADELAGHATVSLAQLAQRPLITLPVGTGIRRQLDQACAAVGVSPRIAFEASTPHALAELAERGLGVAILPRSMARGRPGLRPLRLTPELRGRLVLAWRASGPRSPAARVLVDRARELLRVGAGA